MPTYRQLIGRVQGEQGEPGSPNSIIAQVYTYGISDDLTPPDEWEGTLPEKVDQGKYIWTRCQMTWEYGDDTDIYIVGYVGRDGTFNGEESLVALQNRVQELETRTTPIAKGGTEATTLEGAQAKLGIKKNSDDIAALQTKDSEIDKEITALKAKDTELQSAWDSICQNQRVQFTTVNIAGGASQTFSANIPAISGYSPFAIREYTTNDTHCCVVRAGIRSDGTLGMVVRNVTSAAYDVTPYIDVSYIKNKL